MKGTKVAIAAILLAASVSVVHAQQAGGAPSGTPAHAYNYKTPKLNRAQIDALLAHPDQVVVLDVRRPDELTSVGGLPAYLSIQTADVEKYTAYIPKDRKLVTVSNHAGRAGKIGDLLLSKGFNVVGAIGVENYEEEGGTLSKISPPQKKAAS